MTIMTSILCVEKVPVMTKVISAVCLPSANHSSPFVRPESVSQSEARKQNRPAAPHTSDHQGKVNYYARGRASTESQASKQDKQATWFQGSYDNTVLLALKKALSRL